jgi:UDP-GlcNAc:undecaprenyl-phosphate/decaprenyl-phosphate GlcNAc-1-phosphate transferase
MILILPVIFSFILFLVFIFLVQRHPANFSRFLDLDFNKPQAFHKDPIHRIGGLFILIQLFTIIIFFQIDQILFALIVLLFSNFVLGLLDDTKIIQSPFLRFYIFVLINLFLIIFFNIKINNFDFIFFDYLNSFNFFSYFIILLALFFVINGSNLIDGFNGLLIIHALIIFSILLYICFKLNLMDYFNYIFIIYCGLFFFLFLNFPKAKYFLGDNGSFLIGTSLSYFIIIIANSETKISPFFYAIILYYIFFEIFFSVFRKLFEKRNPFFADKFHLHMLIFMNLNRTHNLSKSNYLTSIYINIVYLFTLIPTIYFYNNTFLCKIYFIILFFSYLFIYLVFRNKCKKSIKL